MKKYTLAFIFTPTFDKVLLMHKLKPDWQKGKINGVGGKIEEGESALACMIREIKEETDLTINEDELIYTANLSSETFFTEVFACIYEGNPDDAKSLEIQQIEWFPTANLPINVMDNLRWLIPLSINKLKTNEPKAVRVTY